MKKKILLYQTLLGDPDDPENVLFQRRYLRKVPHKAPGYSAWNPRSILNELLEPVGATRFFNTAFGKKPVHFKTNDSSRFNYLFSFSQMERLLRFRSVGFSDLKVLDAQSNRLPIDRYSLPVKGLRNERVGLDPDKIMNILNNGGSLAIDGLQKVNPDVTKLAEDFGDWLGQPVGINSYWTPAGGKTFGWHWDTHDVFIFQVHGEKRWELFESIAQHPINSGKDQFSYSKFAEAREDRSRKLMTIRLREGDMLYVPAGTPHDVSAYKNSASMHLTIGLQPRAWVDVVEIATRYAIEKLKQNILLRQQIDVLGPSSCSSEQRRRFAKALATANKTLTNSSFRKKAFKEIKAKK